MSGKKHRAHHKPRPFHRQTPPGAPPGTILADPQAQETAIHMIGYGPQGFRESDVEDPGEIRAFLENWPVTWINVDGLRDAERIRKIGEIFQIHPLALEDVVKVHQRVKAEQYDHQLYLVARMAESEPHEALDLDQLSLFLGDRYVVTFQERPGDGFDPIRERIRSGAGLIRGKGSDYLAYALLDGVIDHYFPVLDAYVERIDALEDQILDSPGKSAPALIHQVRQDLFQLRKCVWPMRDMLNSVLRDPMPFVRDETRLYFRDCYDHVVQIIDHMEIYREVTSNLTDEYISSLSNRLNEVMKVLTIIATIFMPLSFIASLYGMNFKTDASPFNMPELGWRYGYLFALALMITTAGVMLVFFWRRGWIDLSAKNGKKDINGNQTMQ
jgi:magnesium transporter